MTIGSSTYADNVPDGPGPLLKCLLLKMARRVCAIVFSEKSLSSELDRRNYIAPSTFPKLKHTNELQEYVVPIPCQMSLFGGLQLEGPRKCFPG